MKTNKNAAQPHRLSSRAKLDEYLCTIRDVSMPQGPRCGWIQTVRTTLGMTEEQLAKRAGMTQPRLSYIEKMEVKGNLTIKTLDNVAKAMQCRLVYTLVPKESLNQMIEDRALEIVNAELVNMVVMLKREYKIKTRVSLIKMMRKRGVSNFLVKPDGIWNEGGCRARYD